jgi:hypothetical protein
MRIEPASAATLFAILESDVTSIQKMDSQLGEIDLPVEGASFRDLAAIAYILHNIYNAFENSFEHISREFENNVKDVSHWHKELLGKMFLDIPGFRPAVFPAVCRHLLNELRGFRHIFRHSYDFDLDSERLKTLVEHWNEQKDFILGSLIEFGDLLRQQCPKEDET